MNLISLSIYPVCVIANSFLTVKKVFIDVFLTTQKILKKKFKRILMLNRPMLDNVLCQIKKTHAYCIFVKARGNKTAVNEWMNECWVINPEITSLLNYQNGSRLGIGGLCVQTQQPLTPHQQIFPSHNVSGVVMPIKKLQKSLYLSLSTLWKSA